MTEIGVRIRPYPAPQEHPADKEGSPTVSGRLRYVWCNARTLCGNLPASAGACQTPQRAGTIPYLQVREKGSIMPSNDWATRHPELVHWLHQAEDELVGYVPSDALPTPRRCSLSVCSRFLS